MALKGTLKDFGIADILQLIGQQQKTGTLILRAKEQEVLVGFKEGNIVKAESSTRKKKDLIGTMLVRAEIINEQQLEFALENQKRTLKRLGDILVQSRAITAERFREMMNLQVTETLYKLFGWKNGTYAFEQGEVEYDPDVIKPLRAESILMEGFRMVDEWPHIKKKLATYDVTFERLKELPPAPVQEDDGVDDAFDDAFAEEKPTEKKGDFASLGRNERHVFAFVHKGRDVRKIIDLACMGEFETCKSLVNLVNLEYLKIIPAEGKGHALGGEVSALERVRGAFGRLAVTMVVLVALASALSQVNLDSFGLAKAPVSSITDPAAQRFVSRAQVRRIDAAIEVFRLEKGKVPDTLDSLVEAGLLAKDDLRYPWRDPYFYRRVSPSQFILLPPLR
jgi:hypothetical protein